MKKIMYNILFIIVIINLFIITSCSNNSITPHEHIYEKCEIIEEATCSKTGIISYKCLKCDYIYRETYGKLEHIFENNECIWCQKKQLDDGLKYRLIDGGYEVKGITTLSEKEIIIPSEYDGLPVISIGDEAFKECVSLISIEIPNSITSIGQKSFSYCDNLINVYYNGTIEEWCNITFGSYSSNPMYYADHFYQKNELNEWIELTEIIIPNTITSIGKYQFYDFDNITNIKISNGVIRIEEEAFYSCDNLINVTIPKNVTHIEEDAFSGSSKSIIYCETELQPSGWDSYWNSSNRPVYYGINENNFVEKNNLQFVLDLKNKTATLSKYIGISESVKIPKTITYNNIEYSVTNIGDAVFESCISLTNIEIPNSVTNIGDAAFYSCERLISIEIPNSVTSIGNSAFAYCSSLINVEIPNSVITIKDRAFEECSSLNSVIIPNSITTIGDAVFSDCINLISIEIPNSVTSIGGYAFSSCESLRNINIPNSIISIGDWAFDDCENLTSIMIPNSVSIIGEYAFCRCSKLIIYCEALSQPSGWHIYWNESKQPVYFGINENNLIEINKLQYVLDIENKTTTLSKYLGTSESVEIPQIIIYNDIEYSVTNIGKYAFSWCENIKNIQLLSGVTNIGEYAFYCCYSLTSVEIPNSVTNIGEYAFGFCDSLTSVTIPNGVTSIQNSTFYSCGSLKNIEFSNSIISIGEWAFYDCISLTNVVISNSITSIGAYSFYKCINLISIIIPESVKIIAGHTFTDCFNLTIYCENSSKPSGWEFNWNPNNCPVIWSYDINND